MRIVYFNYMEDLYGSSIGSTIKAVELLSHMEKLGHRLFYYWRYGGQTAGPDRPASFLRSAISHPILRRLFFTPKYMAKNAIEMIREYRYIRSVKPHVIILRLDVYRFSVALLAAWMGIPLVLEADSAMSYEWLRYNNRDGNIWKSWLYFFERLCFRLATRVFAQSNVTRTYFADLYGRAVGEIDVITNAAEIRDLHSGAKSKREELGIKADAIVCGFLGSLHFWHGTDFLFRLMERLLTAYPRVCFLIVGGGGPLAGSFRQRCGKLVGSERIFFVDRVEHDRVHEYIDVFDIAVAPYGANGLFYYSPVKIFEYMAGAKAVITTDVGQIGELIVDGRTGLFFDPDDPEDLYEKTVLLLKDSKKRASLGWQAREFIRREHTWFHKAVQLEEICLSAAGMVPREREPECSSGDPGEKDIGNTDQRHAIGARLQDVE